MTKKNFENGRSMVEMLGVLAVMGVLSVAGIAGYTSAMNKHRANELLNEASKRAAIVAVQAMQGRETLSISEFGTENTRLNFSETVDHDTTNNQFTLTITGVAEAVCQQMNNAKGPVIRKFEPATCSGGNNTVNLTYNDDMSTAMRALDYTYENCPNNFYKCATTGKCVESSDKCEACPENSSTTEGTGTSITGTNCKCVSGYKLNTAGTGCDEDTPPDYTNVSCTDYQTNTQCGGVGSGWYCKFNNAEDCTDSDRGTGKCTEITSSETSNNYSSDPMNWWSAYSFCKGLNSTMVTGRTGSSVQCGTLPSRDYGSCSQPTSHPDYYWLDTCADNQITTCSSSSCSAVFVNFGARPRPPMGRNGNAFALCE